MTLTQKGFKELSKKNLTINDVIAIRQSVNTLIDITEGTHKGQLMLLSKSLDDNIYNGIIKSKDKKLAAEFIERKELLEFKKTSFFDNFTKEFGHSGTTIGFSNLRHSSQTLFDSIINTSNKSVANAGKLGDLIKRGIIPDATVRNIKNTLYQNYLNKVVPDSATGKALMSHKEFFKNFGKNYEAILGNKEFKRLYNTKKVIDAFDSSAAAIADINGIVHKYLGLPNWSALSNSGPGEIVEAILSKEFTKTQNLTKLLNALPPSIVKQIREIYLTRMMKEVTSGTFTPNLVNKALQKTLPGGVSSTTTINGALMNGFLNNNRSAILQLYDPSFFQTMRSMADVLEMLQVPKNLANAADMTVKKATENAALFIDMIYGPLNHKRLVLNRFARLLDKTKMNSDNIFLFTDYGLFIEAAKKNFLAGNYPLWVGRLPEKEKVTFINKALTAISKSKFLNKAVNIFNLGLNRGAGVRSTFDLIPKKGNWTAPLKNPMVQKEYLEDQFQEMKGEDRMQDNADIFFPVDVTAKYAVKSLMAVFKGLKKGGEWVEERISEASKEGERDIKEEKFEKELAQ